jgi:Sulfite exporter TauE/SafE
MVAARPRSGCNSDRGVAAGARIGVVAALMGVAGGELLIPTIVLLYRLDIKIAGILSLAISLPTMLVAFERYSRDSSFVVLRNHARFVVTMALGSITGTIIGGLLLGVVPDLVLIPALVGCPAAFRGQGLATPGVPHRHRRHGRSNAATARFYAARMAPPAGDESGARRTQRSRGGLPRGRQYPTVRDVGRPGLVVQRRAYMASCAYPSCGWPV